MNIQPALLSTSRSDGVKGEINYGAFVVNERGLITIPRTHLRCSLALCHTLIYNNNNILNLPVRVAPDGGCRLIKMLFTICLRFISSHFPGSSSFPGSSFSLVEQSEGEEKFQGPFTALEHRVVGKLWPGGWQLEISQSGQGML